MIVTTVIEAASDLVGLAEAWRALWRRTPNATPFQSPDWLLAWWRQFGSGRPLVAVLRAGTELLGVLPCYVLEENGGSKLLPIGVSLSDYLDALVAPDAPPDAAARLLAGVLATTRVAVCDLPDLPPGASLLDAAPPPGWRCDRHGGATCPVLSLQPGCRFDEVVPSQIRRKLRMNRNRAARAGGWTLRWADGASLADDLALLGALHGARWRSKGEPGSFADERVGQFLRDASPSLLAAGALAVVSLIIGNQVAAVVLLLRARDGRVFFYMGGFAEEFAFASPGTLLVGAVIEAAIETGVREVHFLRGDEAYKYSWGARDQHNTARRLSRS